MNNDEGYITIRQLKDFLLRRETVTHSEIITTIIVLCDEIIRMKKDINAVSLGMPVLFK